MLDRTKVLHGPRTQAYGETRHIEHKGQVLDITNPLHGLRTQAYWETRHIEPKSQVLDRTKALHGPRIIYLKQVKATNIIGN